MSVHCDHHSRDEVICDFLRGNEQMSFHNATLVNTFGLIIFERSRSRYYR